MDRLRRGDVCQDMLDRIRTWARIDDSDLPRLTAVQDLPDERRLCRRLLRLFVCQKLLHGHEVAFVRSESSSDPDFLTGNVEDSETAVAGR